MLKYAREVTPNESKFRRLGPDAISGELIAPKFGENRNSCDGRFHLVYGRERSKGNGRLGK